MPKFYKKKKNENFPIYIFDLYQNKIEKEYLLLISV
ncbi:hypothetical protein HH_1089 [Helicobacter hepaticus ATCC 51449]|uniref:Uncharacterized protein n=1 Tax=Helicobacter hepaticus (strain ATCC 51449 / 3B1) TaxID=235279 RepID=Q7VH78_HELHP|nr:hypothetical protein HH_1089 [Helicobacter hepaticus ATCC 51449]